MDRKNTESKNLIIKDMTMGTIKIMIIIIIIQILTIKNGKMIIMAVTIIINIRKKITIMTIRR